MTEVDQKERVQRLQVIAVEMDKLVRELGPKWIRLAYLREESKQIVEELRNVPIEGK